MDHVETLDPAASLESSTFLPRMLIVDDDRVHRMVLARTARKAGYDPVEAESYEVMLHLMRDGDYRCATVDLSLGNRGGLEVLGHLAQLKFAEPVIVVSGSEDDVRGEATMVARRLGLNVLGSFGKPIDLSRLRDLLGEIHKRQVVGLTPRGS